MSSFTANTGGAGEESIAPGSKSFGEASRLLGRVLSFRATKDELLALNGYDLVLGLMLTWLVGIGRYWDNDRVELLQQMGVGSVVYVFVLATIVFLMLWPLRPQNWSWFRLLVFITLTSPPAAIYALPVQMMYPEPGLTTANEINLVFMWIVSAWRVSLLVFYLARVCAMGVFLSIVGAAFPILTIIICLAILNLERVVFNFMMGVDESSASPNDDIYLFLFGVLLLTYILFIPLVIIYGILVYVRWKKRALISEVIREDDDLSPTQNEDASGG